LILQPARSDVKIGPARAHGNRLTISYYSALTKVDLVDRFSLSLFPTIINSDLNLNLKAWT